MNAKENTDRPSRLHIAAGFGAAVMLAALACETLRVVDSQALRSFGSGLAVIHPLSALGFSLAGLALACASFARPAIRRLTFPLATLVVAIGLLKACGAFLPAAFRLEKMPPADGWSLLLAGGALIIRSPGARVRTAVSQALAMAAGSAALLALIGCIYGGLHFYQRSNSLSMALPSAVMLFLLAAGVLSLDPSSAILRGVTASSAGGVMVRRLFPFVILVPVVFGTLGLQTLRAGILDRELGAALVTLAIIVAFGALVWVMGGALARIDENQRRASEALEREREFLNVLLENFHDGVLACDERGNLSIFNRATRALHGLPGSATPPERWAARYDLYDVEGKAHLAMKDIPLYRAFQGERVHEEEMLIKSQRSGRRRVVCNGQAMFNSQGRKIGAVVVMSDITERRRAEEALRKSEERLRMVIGKAPVVMWATDAKGVFTFSDGSALHLLGLTPGQAVGHSIFDVFRRHEQICGDHTLALTGTVVESAVEVDGVIFDSRLTPTFNDAGAVTGIIGVATDVTERRRAEEALRQANEQLEQRVYERTRDLVATNEHLGAEITQRERAERARQRSDEGFALLVDGVQDYGIVMLDAAGCVASWNKGAERLNGYEAAEIVGRHYSSFCLPGEAAVGRTEKDLQLAAAEGRMEAESWRARKDGSRFFANVVITALRDDTGKLRGFAEIARDITAWKTAEENLVRAKQQAEQANEAKTEFLSRMSHELRTPLNAILGFAQVLEMDELPLDQATCVGHISRAGTHLLELVNEVLEISRIEAGCDNVPAQPVAVASAVCEALEMVRAEAEGRGIEIIVEDSVEEAWVAADRLRLKQVLINLLANAVKYNRDGGAVTIFCEPGATDDQHIHVRDTGLGISLEKLPRLFTPFDRLGAEQRGVAGTGLGLAASKRLVEAMGGSLGVCSTEGKGSTFTVTLPAASKADAFFQNPIALHDVPDFAPA
jgi:PAS domain S-box-containing protein